MDDCDRAKTATTDGPDRAETSPDGGEASTDHRDRAETYTDGGDREETSTDDIERAETSAEGRGRPCGALGDAIAATLGGVIRDFDARANGVSQSQEELSLSLNRLTSELDKLLEDAPTPLIMQQAAKISSIRRRVSALNLLLKSIQRRIDYIDRTLSTDNVGAAGASSASKLT
ncbi:hypothetical protein LUZ60_002137 [Juncus effusus]|nr:hypothetical protein LUZ60_002137 [Juncus effusus]